MRQLVLGSLLLVGLTTSIDAREKVKAIQLGEKIPAFKNLPTATGKKISLNDFTQDVLVVVVTCNECPVAQAYEPRFVEFAKSHSGPGAKVALLAVNPYDREGDSLEDMKKRAEASALPFEYAQDKDHQLTLQLGAEKTPHVFVFNKDRNLVYKGAFDDSWADPEAVKRHYLVEVVTAMLSGKPVPPVTKPEGCPIHID